LVAATLISGSLTLGVMANQNSKDSLVYQNAGGNVSAKQPTTFNGASLSSKTSSKNTSSVSQVKVEKNCSKHSANKMNCTMHCQ